MGEKNRKRRVVAKQEEKGLIPSRGRRAMPRRKQRRFFEDRREERSELSLIKWFPRQCDKFGRFNTSFIRLLGSGSSFFFDSLPFLVHSVDVVGFFPFILLHETLGSVSFFYIVAPLSLSIRTFFCDNTDSTIYCSIMYIQKCNLSKATTYPFPPSLGEKKT